ncbi:MAG TPA: FISUMP domain-containing protein [Cytophagaceae bacterium]|jgi:uncharacterized protein (TIGR02145 family)|nr:FISUMP domain-containing protein [Cytophagaceae bacterium]
MRLKFLLIVLMFYSNSGIAQEDLIDPRDGQVYKTVKIGNQIWMAQNLNYETKDSIFYKEEMLTFMPGKMLPGHFISDSHCYNDSAANCDKYGRLYIWKAAEKACPVGWHLPSKEEFKILLSELNYKDVNQFYKILLPGGRSGFNLMLGGYGHRMSVLTIQQFYLSKGRKAEFWTSSIYKMGRYGFEGYGIEFMSKKVKEKLKIHTFSVEPIYLFSVRCIKN